jgi:membrane-associated protease RseP (regulator of RpoE activity)
MLRSVEGTNSANSRYVASLALVAGLILIAGWLGRPRQIPTAPAPVPSETELQQLARRAERRDLENTTDYFAALARDAAASLVPIAATQTTGVIWGEGRILALTASDNATSANASSGEPRLSVSVIERPEARATADRARTMPNAGEWVFVAWRTGEQHAHMAGTFGQVASTVCGGTQVTEVVTSMYFTRPMLGGGLFDLDGGLLAVVLPCDQRLAAITSAGVDTMLRIDQSASQRFFRRYGVTLGDMPDDAVSFFKDVDGVLVREIREQSAADLAGFYAGDVVTAINGAPISGLSQLEALVGQPSQPLDVQVRRGSRRIEKTLSARPDGGNPAGLGAGIRWETTTSGFGIEQIEPGSRAAAAGLQKGDRVIRLNYVVPRNVTPIERALAAADGPATLLEVDRGDRRIAIFLK